MKRFALIGVAGYIAPRHLQAIKETENDLLAVLDPHDSVGIIDRYFPDADYFREFERFDRHLDKMRRDGKPIDYVSICSPNFLHDAHIRFGLRNHADVICEKPIVLNPWNIDALQVVERESGNKINTILQLRLHPAIIELKRRVDEDKSGKIYDIDLSYITSRGNWYLFSWKGDISKSGGVATNIGIHFFDMLAWIFGEVKQSVVHLSQPTKAAGFLSLEKANVRWLLSLDRRDLPKEAVGAGQTTYRSIKIQEEELEFSGGFTDLHTLSYQKILDGNGFGLEDAKRSVDIAYQIRKSVPVGLKGEFHSMLKKILG